MFVIGNATKANKYDTRKVEKSLPDFELNYRSKKRVRDLGEVFTPESSVIDMLKLVSRSNRAIWRNDNISFFEPCCGHGNIVMVIYKKRLEGFYKKTLSKKYNNPAHYAIANTINTLWAIDIDSQNVTHCKTRVLRHTLEFIREKTGISSDASIISQDTEFFAHILCAINWHIHENETLSSLSCTNTAFDNAGKTQAGQRWIAQSGHRPLDFHTSWVDYFQASKIDNLIPLNFERSTRFIQNRLIGKGEDNTEFEFADFLMRKPATTSNQLARSKNRAVG